MMSGIQMRNGLDTYSYCMSMPGKLLHVLWRCVRCLHSQSRTDSVVWTDFVDWVSDFVVYCVCSMKDE